ncbi:MAG: hypothetical protein ACE5FU_08465 [Nitrospinota bacterium]
MSFQKSMSVLAAFLLLTVVTGSTVLADDGETRMDIKGEDILVDFFVVRPISMAGSALLTSVFVLSLPFSILGGNTGPVFKKLVLEPGRFAFRRPLGEFKRF